MSDRDEFSAENAEQATPVVAEEATSATGENGDIAGEGIGTGEVRAVQKQQRSSNVALLLGVLLLVVLIGGAFFLVQSDVSSRTPQFNSEAPKRYSIEKIEEEVVSGPAVASVEVAAAIEQSVGENPPAVADAKPKPIAKQEVVAKQEAADKQPVGELNNGHLYQVLVGPFLYVSDTEKAEQKLQRLGYKSEKIDGRGAVTMYRLHEGSYPPAAAREKLPPVKKLAGDAFLLPDGNQLAIYVGSFSDHGRAENYQRDLLEKGLKVAIVTSDVEMSGKMFVVGEADLAQARDVAAKLTRNGFSPQVVRK